MQTINVTGYGQLNFPDGMTDSQISAAIQNGIKSGKLTPVNEAFSSQPQPENKIGMSGESSPGFESLDRVSSSLLNPRYINPRDIAAGAAGQLQRIGVGMGELGQGIARTFTNVPSINIRELGGLEGDNQVDLQKIIQSKDPDPASLLIGGMLPGALTGGASVPGQIIANTAANTAAASPTQENLGGYLPSGRTGAAIENVGAGLLAGYVAPKVFTGILNSARNNNAGMFRRINLEGLIKRIQSRHDALSNEASGLYNTVKNEVKNRGIQNVPIDETLLDEAESYFPKTKQNVALINKARNGDYEAIHKVQSDLGKRGQKMKSSSFGADRDQGELMLDLRQEINDNTHDFFKNNGHEDLSESLKVASDKFKKLKDLYYGYNPITKVVGDLREVPKDPINLLGKNNRPVNKLLNEHPDIKKDVETYLARQKLKKKLVGLGVAGAVTTGILSGKKSLTSLIF